MPGRGHNPQPVPLQLHVHGPRARGAVERGGRPVPQDATGGGEAQRAHVPAADRGHGPMPEAGDGEDDFVCVFVFVCVCLVWCSSGS